jgi:tripartite-type tricarboxylate transporter receptor subunit TctC
MKKLTVIAAASIACGGIITHAGAQTKPADAGYPVKPLRLIVAVQPGGNLDLMGRAVAQRIGEGLGRPMIVENRPGANTVIGVEHVAKSAPDGYTFLMAAPSLLVTPILMKNPPFDPVRDFAGVSLIATLPQMLVVHPSVPARNVKELIALAKSQKDPLICVTSGNGSGSHLAMERFKRMAGVRLLRVAYNGDAQANIQLLGGQVPMKFDNLSTSLPHVNSGRLRALGITTPTRSELLPGLPAIAETLPGFEASIFNGMVAPTGTPRELLARVQGEIRKFAQAPDNRARFAQQGVELQDSTPEEFTAFLKAEHARMVTLVKEAGITPD